MDFLHQFLTSVATILFSLLIFRYILSLWWPRTPKSGASKSNIAPEAAGAWPVIGHLHLLGAGKLPHVTLGNMADKCGPIFTIRLGVHRALVVSSWEVAKECLTTNDLTFASRPNSVAIKHMGYNYAMFGFGPYGSYWREVRKIATLELLSSRRLEMLKHVRTSEVQTCIRELYEMWMNKNKGTASGPGSCPVLVELRRWFGDLSLNIVVRMVAGKRYFGEAISCDEGEAQRCQKAVREFLHLAGLFVVSDSLPFLGWLDLQGHERAMKKIAKELDSVLEGLLEEHRRKRLSGGEAMKEQDFMDVMMSIMKDIQFTEHDSDTTIKSTCLNLILAANDTTMVTLTWTLSLLLNNRDVLKRAQDELDTQIGRDRQVNESDIKNLVYLQAIVKEVLRLYPPVPLGGPRMATEDCTVAGYHVPAGTRLLVNVWKIQRDPYVWSDPSEFRPERFLTSHLHIDPKGQHFEFIPFGAGRRVCPGISFAFQVVHLTLASLLHGFDFETPLKAPVNMTESPGMTNIKATPLEVALTPRQHFKLYGC